MKRITFSTLLFIEGLLGDMRKIISLLFTLILLAVLSACERTPEGFTKYDICELVITTKVISETQTSTMSEIQILEDVFVKETELTYVVRYIGEDFENIEMFKEVETLNADSTTTVTTYRIREMASEFENYHQRVDIGEYKTYSKDLGMCEAFFPNILIYQENDITIFTKASGCNRPMDGVAFVYIEVNGNLIPIDKAIREKIITVEDVLNSCSQYSSTRDNMYK
ncbi:hypothetical protein RJG79_04515 [Mycoplasmatota bacterium WC44]